MGFKRHPVATAALVERALAEAKTLAPEERILLRQVLRALEFFPWNRWAVKNADGAAALLDASMEVNSTGPPGAFFQTALCHLMPVVPSAGVAPPTLDCEPVA